VVAVVTPRDGTAKEEVSKKKINENIRADGERTAAGGTATRCVTKAHEEGGDAAHASTGTRRGGGMSASSCVATVVVVGLVGPGRPSREKAGISVSREGRVQGQRPGCKRGRQKKKKNEKMRKHTSLAACHFLADPPNATSYRVLEGTMRKGGQQWQTRKHEG
jgi:hypothetical protein